METKSLAKTIIDQGGRNQVTSESSIDQDGRAQVIGQDGQGKVKCEPVISKESSVKPVIDQYGRNQACSETSHRARRPNASLQ